MESLHAVNDRGVVEAIEACARSEADGRRRLAALRGQRLGQMVLRIVGDPRRAEVIVDDVLSEAARRAAGFDARSTPVDDWLFALARARIAADNASIGQVPPAAPQPPASPPVPPAEAPPAATGEPRSARFPTPADVVPRRRPVRRRRARRFGWWAMAVVAVGAALASVLLPTTDGPPDPTSAPREGPPAGLAGLQPGGRPLVSPVPLDPPLVAPEPLDPALVAPEPADEPRPPPAPRTAMSAGPPRIFIHHTVGTAIGGRATMVADYLAQRGMKVVGIRAVPVSIASRSVRYFYPEDRELAIAVADALDARDGGGPEPDAARLADLTHYVPKPLPGTIEVWLPTPPDARFPDD